MLDDLRFGLRRVLRAPLSSIGIIVILSAGIGATGAMVSVLDALVYRPLNLPHPESLVAVGSRDARGLLRLTPLVSIEHLRASDLPVDGWCAQNMTIEPTVPGEGRAWVGLLTSDCFKVFGVQPVLGRGFDPNETPFTGAGSPVAVFSHAFWQRAFGGSPDVLGRTLCRRQHDDDRRRDHAGRLHGLVEGHRHRRLGAVQRPSDRDRFSRLHRPAASGCVTREPAPARGGDLARAHRDGVA